MLNLEDILSRQKMFKRNGLRPVLKSMEDTLIRIEKYR